MPSTPVQFIYFDLDDTLLDHRQAEQRGLAEVRQAYSTSFDPLSLEVIHATYHAHSVPLWRQYADGEISKEALQRLRFERTLQALDIGDLDADVVNAYYLTCYARHWTWPEEARRAFHTLADHFPVGILTNGFAEVQHAKFARFPALRDRARALIISEEVGVMKPHPGIFAHATTLAGVPGDAILYVGDSYTSDVQGALGAGWRSAWYTKADAGTQAEVFCFQQWEVLTRHLLGSSA